jgi:hypothetical protein
MKMVGLSRRSIDVIGNGRNFFPVLSETQVAISCDEHARDQYIASVTGSIHGDEARVETEVSISTFGGLIEDWAEGEGMVRIK